MRLLQRIAPFKRGWKHLATIFAIRRKGTTIPISNISLLITNSIRIRLIIALLLLKHLPIHLEHLMRHPRECGISDLYCTYFIRCIKKQNSVEIHETSCLEKEFFYESSLAARNGI